MISFCLFLSLFVWGNAFIAYIPMNWHTRPQNVSYYGWRSTGRSGWCVFFVSLSLSVFIRTSSVSALSCDLACSAHTSLDIMLCRTMRSVWRTNGEKMNVFDYTAITTIFRAFVWSHTQTQKSWATRLRGYTFACVWCIKQCWHIDDNCMRHTRAHRLTAQRIQFIYGKRIIRLCCDF